MDITMADQRGFRSLSDHQRTEPATWGGELDVQFGQPAQQESRLRVLAQHLLEVRSVAEGLHRKQISLHARSSREVRR
jgi:hypothetical protein